MPLYRSLPTPQTKQFKRYENDHLQIECELIDLIDGLQQADLFVGHGNMASLCESLQLGTPVLAMPIQLEQPISAKTLQRTGAGKCQLQVASAQELAQTIHTMATDPTLKNNALNFAEQAKPHLQHSLTNTVADNYWALKKSRE